MKLLGREDRICGTSIIVVVIIILATVSQESLVFSHFCLVVLPNGSLVTTKAGDTDLSQHHVPVVQAVSLGQSLGIVKVSKHDAPRC